MHCVQRLAKVARGDIIVNVRSRSDSAHQSHGHATRHARGRVLDSFLEVRKLGAKDKVILLVTAGASKRIMVSVGIRETASVPVARMFFGDLPLNALRI